MRIEEIAPHGFCGGVARAIGIARKALEESGGKEVFCLHDIVHNATVAARLRDAGMRVARSVNDIPEGAWMLVSAHGAPPADIQAASARRIRVVDATCPFVAAGHERIRANFAKGVRTVIVGSPDHAEVRGYLGEKGACVADDVKPGEKVGMVVQTTLGAEGRDGVCTATEDRRQAVRSFVEGCLADGVPPGAVGVVVAGSPESANTVGLVGVAERCGARVWRASGPADVGKMDMAGIRVLGVTSGASTPEDVYRAVFQACGEVRTGM